MTWDPDLIARIAIDAFAREDGQGRSDQRVHGIDALDETDAQALLALALAAPNSRVGRSVERWGVLREVPYPTIGLDRAGKLRRSERRRCDLVLLPSFESSLADPVRDLAAARGAAGTLFEHHAAPDSPNTTPPDEAYWLEVKVVGQFCFRDGVPGPNTAYATELTAALVDDVAKLGDDVAMRHAAVLLVLFTADEMTAEHDVAVSLHRVLDRGITFRAPVMHRCGIQDRIGNAVCSVVLVPGVPA